MFSKNMKDYIKEQSGGFIQIPILIIFAGIIIAVSIIGINQYRNHELEKTKVEYEIQDQKKTNANLQAIEIEKLKNEVDQLKNRPAPTDQKNNQETQKNMLPVSADVAPPNTTLCNGMYWTSCPIGQKFYCPPTGSAQCIEEQKQSTTNVSVSAQQKCLTEGLRMLTDEENKYPNINDLVSQKNVLLITLYPDSTWSSGEKAVITTEETASLTPEQKNAIKSGDRSSIEKELDSVNAKLRTSEDRMSRFGDFLYSIRLFCGAVSTEDQMIHELQKIRESLDKLGV